MLTADIAKRPPTGTFGSKEQPQKICVDAASHQKHITDSPNHRCRTGWLTIRTRSLYLYYMQATSIFCLLCGDFARVSFVAAVPSFNCFLWVWHHKRAVTNHMFIFFKKLWSSALFFRLSWYTSPAVDSQTWPVVLDFGILAQFGLAKWALFGNKVFKIPQLHIENEGRGPRQCPLYLAYLIWKNPHSIHKKTRPKAYNWKARTNPIRFNTIHKLDARIS